MWTDESFEFLFISFSEMKTDAEGEPAGGGCWGTHVQKENFYRRSCRWWGSRREKTLGLLEGVAKGGTFSEAENQAEARDLFLIGGSTGGCNLAQ